jgi:hypothetical protein
MPSEIGHRLVIVAVRQPPMPPTSDQQLSLRHTRPLRGDLLCDEDGRFFERIGDHVRPIHHLVPGPDGDVLDLMPRDHRHAAESADEEAIDAGVRSLLPEPGLRRVIQFSDFRAMLLPQLAHPERIRDGHRLACLVQVYELTNDSTMEQVAETITGRAERTGELQPLTVAAANLLGLTRAIARRRPPGNTAGPAGSGLRAGDRLLHLEIESDPTTNLATTMSAAAAAGIAVPANLPKKSIPDRFVQPWEFVISRDEAVYDARTDATRSWWSTALRRLGARLRGSGDLRKWQSMLIGKGADEQLWGVRPPRRGLDDPRVREWARPTLAAAGYDESMVSEWELFWRRKGL